MDTFQSVQSGQGLLKNSYDTGSKGESPLSIALKKKRDKLSQSKLGESYPEQDVTKQVGGDKNE